VRREAGRHPECPSQRREGARRGRGSDGGALAAAEEDEVARGSGRERSAVVSPWSQRKEGVAAAATGEGGAALGVD